MAVNITNLTQGNNTGSVTTGTSASITPVPNALILLSVMSRRGDSTEPSVPTITGNGLTWVAVNNIYYDTTSGSRKKLSLFRAMGRNPSTGTVLIDFGAETQTDIFWTIDQGTGVNTSGTNGSGAVVQSATNKKDAGDGGILVVTLGAFGNLQNATYGSFTVDDVSAAIIVGSGFTQLGEQHPSGLQSTLTEWKTTNDTSVDATAPAVAGVCTGGIAIEIKSSQDSLPNNYQFVSAGNGMSVTEKIR